MDLSHGREWQPPDDWRRIEVIESHTGGEPFRVVVGGLPEVAGDTMQERRRFARDQFDHLRRFLMWEPRGHADMYGGWIDKPVRDDSDLSVLFLHNEGFSTMCGHGIIALTKVVLDTGILDPRSSEPTIRIDTPAGQVTGTADLVDSQVRRVRFRNVPSFVAELDSTVAVAGLGEITYDLAFGGAYYAYVDAAEVGLAWPPDDPSDLIDKGRRIKAAVARSVNIVHPEQSDLGFLYGVIFTGPAVERTNHSRNVCVFADGQIDRSPTGTGVSGRVAIEAARGNLAVGESITVESIVGSTFNGTLAESTTIGNHPAVISEIEGTAYITGRSTFWVDPADGLGEGFLIR